MFEMLKKIGNRFGEEIVSHMSIITYFIGVTIFAYVIGILILLALRYNTTIEAQSCDQIHKNLGYRTGMVGSTCYVAVGGSWYSRTRFQYEQSKPVEQCK